MEEFEKERDELLQTVIAPFFAAVENIR